MEIRQQEVSGVRLRDMVRAVRWDRRRKRVERIEILNRVNDRYFDWVNTHKEVGFGVALNGKQCVEIEVIGFEDGSWISDCSVHLSDRGWGHGLNAPNELFPSKEEAVLHSVIEAVIYLLHQLNSHTSDTVKGQSKKCIKACMEVLLGKKAQLTLF